MFSPNIAPVWLVPIIFIVITLVFFLAKLWIASHIRSSVELSYSKNFEEYKSSLETQRILALRQIENVQAVSNDAFMQGQRLTAERRIDAVSVLWRGMVRLKRTQPLAVIILDSLPLERYDEMINQSYFRSQVDDMKVLTAESYIDEWSKDEVEQVRPFIGESCFALYSHYRATIHLIPLLLRQDVMSGEKVVPWFDHPEAPDVLSATLNEEEIDELKNRTTYSITRFSEVVELKVLEHIGQVISGNLSADEGLVRARKSQSAVEDLILSSVANRSILGSTPSPLERGSSE